MPLTFTVEFHPNPDMATLHLDARLPYSADFSLRDQRNSFDLNRKDRTHSEWSFLLRIAGIDGVDHIYTNNYECTIAKGRVFAWEPILDKAKTIITEWFATQADESAGQPRVEPEIDEPEIDEPKIDGPKSFL